jgi:hypothetical protein
MDNDPLIRMTRRFSVIAGITLVLTPVLGLVLELMELKTFRRFGLRDMTGFLLLLSMAMFGSVMLNLTLTISRVAERLAPNATGRAAGQTGSSGFRPKRVIGIFIAVLVAIGVIDHLAVRRIEAELTERANQSTTRFANAIEKMANYRYEEGWISDTSRHLALMERQGSYSNVSLILRDAINEQAVYLTFRAGTSTSDDEAEPRIRHALQATAEELAYLDGVFDSGNMVARFWARSERYEVLLPVKAGGRVVVLRFGDDDR